MPESAELAPWAEGVPHWDELDETEQRVAARFMETYAGFAEHADVQVGRFVDALEDMGVLDDTLIFYLLGDNGASGEGGPRGTFREHLVGHGIQDETADMAARLDTLGDATTYAIYPAGWALAMNTPYPWTKQVAHLGGTRDGMIVRWGERDRGARRGPPPVAPRHRRAADHPRGRRARRRPRPSAASTQQPIEGTSLRYSFDDADAPDRHTTQYFEMIGNRGRLPRGLDGGDPPRRPLGDGRHAEAALRRGRLGALRPRRRLEPGPRPRRRSTPSGCGSCRRCSSARPRSSTSSRSTTGSPSARTRRSPAGSTCTSAARRCRSVRGSAGSPRRRPPTSRTAPTSSPPTSRWSPAPTAWWSRRAAGSAAGRCTSSAACRTTPTTSSAATSPSSAAGSRCAPGRHDLVVRFAYDGGPPGSGADVTLEVDGAAVGSGRDPGDDGVLLLLRRDLQRRGRPRHPGRRRLPAGAQPVRGRHPPGALRPGRGGRPGHPRGARAGGHGPPVTTS